MGREQISFGGKTESIPYEVTVSVKGVGIEIVGFEGKVSFPMDIGERGSSRCIFFGDEILLVFEYIFTNMPIGCSKFTPRGCTVLNL